MIKAVKTICVLLTFMMICGVSSTLAGIQQNKISVSGLVADENGDPMIGVQIKVKGTTVGIITDVNGNFSLTAKVGDVLEFSYVGYKDIEKEYKGEKVLAIQMFPATEQLDEVVVIGYGKQKKNSVVSSINSITPGQLAVSPSRNLTNNLAGQVPGLIAVQRSGEPGYDNSEFWIRGVSSFKGGTNPLILVDGVPRAMQDIETDEIESFTLLKDAAATAVYGAEGANGVILITSKRGRAEKPKFSFRAEATMLSPTRIPGFMNAADALSLYDESLRNEGKPEAFGQELISKYASGEDPDLYPDTDWIDGMLRDHTYNMRYTLSVRGGTERARYFVSGAYYKENGIFQNLNKDDYNNNIDLQRFNLRSNIDFDATKTTLIKVDISGQYLMTNYPGVGTSTIFRGMCTTPPYLIPMVYSDGTIAGHPRASGNRVNPYNQLVNSGYTKEWRTAIQSKVEINQKLDFLTKGLSWKASISYDGNMSYIRKRTKSPSTYVATGRGDDGQLTYKTISNGTDNLTDPSITSSSDKQIYFETSFNYSRTFAEKHDVGAMALYMQKDRQKFDVALPYRKQGLVGRVTYAYDGRYFLEGNFGYTGSETFASGNRFGFFPAVGLAWYASNEHFYPEALKKVVNKLKLRFSYGRTGNDDTGGDRFLYRATMKTDASGYNTGYNNNGADNRTNYGTGLVEGLFAAPYLTWEIEDKQNYGIDLGLFDSRVDLQVDYFQNKRKSILLQRSTVSNVTGFQQMPWQNFGIVKNHGVDASLTLNQQVGEVKLSARGNFTFARNEIVEFDQTPQPYPWMEKKGTRLNSWNLYIADGLYTDDDFVISGAGSNKTYTLKQGVPTGLSSGVMPGDIKYKDLNGDGKIDSNDQMQDVGNPSVPEIVYGFGLNAEWRGFYAGVFFQGAGKTSTVLGSGDNPQNFFPFHFTYDETSVRSVVADRWTQENPSQNVMFPRLHSAKFDNNTTPSTWWLRDASFLRFKNVEFGYNFDKKHLKKLKLESLRVYFQGNNLCVWDNIKMWDPEQGNSNDGFNYPLSRTFTLGLDFTF